jgi:hypothetical protein
MLRKSGQRCSWGFSEAPESTDMQALKTIIVPDGRIQPDFAGFSLPRRRISDDYKPPILKALALKRMLIQCCRLALSSQIIMAIRPAGAISSRRPVLHAQLLHLPRSAH